jgi:NADH-quinone oxidoreductase subunit C
MAATVHEQIAARWAKEAQELSASHGTLALLIAPDRLLEVARSLQGQFGFDLLLDVTAVDWPARDPRFDVVYHFYSTHDLVRVRLKTRVAAAQAVVDTLVPLYNSARFAERECHDMYGIEFRGNADLRPILLYEGFVGHPLRKDYPKQRAQPLVPYRT